MLLPEAKSHKNMCSKKKNHEKKKYYKLWKGGEIQEENGRDHITIVENIDNKGRFLYITGGLEHNEPGYARYYTFYKDFKASRI